MKRSHVSKTLRALCLFVAFMLCTAQVGFAAEKTTGPAFTVALEGEQIGDSDRYGGVVTMQITLAKPGKGVSLWIKGDDGIWKLIPRPEKEEAYRLSFSQDGDYRFELRAEEETTREQNVQDVLFSVDAALAGVIKSIEELPDPDNVQGEALLVRRDDILSALNTYNGLRAAQRRAAPDAVDKALEDLRIELERADPAGDYKIPSAPKIVYSGGESEDDVYAPSVELSVTAAAGESVFVNDGSGWHPLERDGAGKYAMRYEEEGSYHVDFCLEDAANNRSKSASADFIVDEEVANLVSETERLYRNAQSLDQKEYIETLERLNLSYLKLTPLRQSYVPALTASRVAYMYESILEGIKFTNQVADKDGNYIQTVGLYGALNVPTSRLGGSAVSLVASRAESITPLPEGTGGEILATYDFSFTCAGVDEPLAVREATQIRIRMQVPSDLLGKKNIDMLYLGGEEPQRMNAKVRSTLDGLVLSFDTAFAGKYAFVSLPAES